MNDWVVIKNGNAESLREGELGSEAAAEDER